MPPIYTIGYGTRPMTVFLDLLQQYDVAYLIDVRSTPHATYKTEYSQEPLRTILAKAGIRYVFMGDLLGGKPSDESCYTDGKLDYSVVMTKDFFQKGIQRLEKALEKECVLCLMCGELRAYECHRGKLIGQALLKKNISLLHIDEKGLLKTQVQSMTYLTKGMQNLFEE